MVGASRFSIDTHIAWLTLARTTIRLLKNFDSRWRKGFALSICHEQVTGFIRPTCLDELDHPGESWHTCVPVDAGVYAPQV